MDVDAELRNAFVGSGRATGFVHGDKKQRFRDGELITTSEIVTREGDIIRTRNSTYRLIEGASPTQP